MLTAACREVAKGYTTTFVAITNCLPYNSLRLSMRNLHLYGAQLRLITYNLA